MKCTEYLTQNLHLWYYWERFRGFHTHFSVLLQKTCRPLQWALVTCCLDNRVSKISLHSVLAVIKIDKYFGYQFGYQFLLNCCWTNFPKSSHWCQKKKKKNPVKMRKFSSEQASPAVIPERFCEKKTTHMLGTFGLLA